jgi:hypothetical protein
MIKSKDAKAKPEQQQAAARAIVAPDALDNLKRRAEEIGLIVHAKATTAGREQKNKRKK